MRDEFKNKIMKRVYMLWFMRKVAPALFLYMPLLLLISMREVAREFFVAQVIDNFIGAAHGGGFLGAMDFVMSALANTPIVPVSIIIFAGGTFVFLFQKMVKGVKRAKPVGIYS